MYDNIIIISSPSCSYSQHTSIVKIINHINKDYSSVHEFVCIHIPLWHQKSCFHSARLVELWRHTVVIVCVCVCVCVCVLVS